jgi:hypothetical protein
MDFLINTLQTDKQEYFEDMQLSLREQDKKYAAEFAAKCSRSEEYISDFAIGLKELMESSMNHLEQIIQANESRIQSQYDDMITRLTKEHEKLSTEVKIHEAEHEKVLKDLHAERSILQTTPSVLTCRSAIETLRSKVEEGERRSVTLRNFRKSSIKANQELLILNSAITELREKLH